MEDGLILHNCNNFGSNREKMAKNYPNMTEINLGVPYMINDFLFFNFFFLVLNLNLTKFKETNSKTWV